MTDKQEFDIEEFEGAIGVFGGSEHNSHLPYKLLTPRRSIGFVKCHLTIV